MVLYIIFVSPGVGLPIIDEMIIVSCIITENEDEL